MSSPRVSVRFWQTERRLAYIDDLIVPFRPLSEDSSSNALPSPSSDNSDSSEEDNEISRYGKLRKSIQDGKEIRATLSRDADGPDEVEVKYQESRAAGPILDDRSQGPSNRVSRAEDDLPPSPGSWASKSPQDPDMLVLEPSLAEFNYHFKGERTLRRVSIFQPPKERQTAVSPTLNIKVNDQECGLVEDFESLHLGFTSN